MKIVIPDPQYSALQKVLKELYLLKIGLKNKNYETCDKKVDLIRTIVQEIINKKQLTGVKLCLYSNQMHPQLSWTEQRPSKPWVTGSNPVGCTMLKEKTMDDTKITNKKLQEQVDFLKTRVSTLQDSFLMLKSEVNAFRTGVEADMKAVIKKVLESQI